MIADDHPIFRHGLREIIERSSKFKILAEAADGEAALRLVSELKPDIAIVDMDMPRLNGLKMMREITRSGLAVAVIFLTMHKEEDLYNAAMDQGAKAYVLKENAATDIVVALKTVADGEIYVSPWMSDINQRRQDRVQELLSSKPQIETPVSG